MSWAGFRLRALGRLREALDPMQAAVDNCVKQKIWQHAAVGASNLSELQLTLGDVGAAVGSGQYSENYADRSGDLYQCILNRTTRADALHQAGETLLALALFNEAEQRQKKLLPKYPRLFTLAGFRCCDLLLTQNRTTEVLKRAKYALTILKRTAGFLVVAMGQLILGKVYLQRKNFPQTTCWLEPAVTGLRKAGQNQYLPLGLLARAALHRDTRNPNYDFTRAHQDLQEVHDIAEPSGMRLHLTDYHLEMARLLIAEQKNPQQSSIEKGESAEDSPQKHIAKAARLIEETGYNRRLPELVELQNRIAE